MTATPLNFTHVFEPGSGPEAETTLLLLHGTGGNEQDLLPIGRVVLPGAALLSPRGKVLEHGAPRFFRRLAEGVFDIPDLIARTYELSSFVAEAAQHYQFDPLRVIALGYSNGANIAGGMLLLTPKTCAGAVLLRPMVPLVPDAAPDLTGVRVFVAAGRVDPLITPAQSEDLAVLLGRYGAQVTMHWADGGHAITRAELSAAQEWLAAPASGTKVAGE